jgi:hypothetical protein
MALNIGQGTILKMTISSTLTAIAQVLEIEGPEVDVGSKETTNLGNTVKTFRAQLPDAGTVSLSIQYDPADTTHTALTTAVMSWPQAAVTWNIQFNTTAGTDKAVFTAFLTKFKPKGMNSEDNLEADIELKLTGTITWS